MRGHRSQSIPVNFLVNILSDLRTAGLVASQRGASGGYWLARRPNTISVGEIIRAVEGDIALVRGIAPQNLSYNATAEPLQHVWIAYRASIFEVLDGVSLSDLASGRLPDTVLRLSGRAEAWNSA